MTEPQPQTVVEMPLYEGSMLQPGTRTVIYSDADVAYLRREAERAAVDADRKAALAAAAAAQVAAGGHRP